MCKGLITLSNYLKKYLEDHLGCNIPILSLQHPTQFVTNDNCFTMEKFLANNSRMLISIGGWYRDITSIYRLHVDNIKTRSKDAVQVIRQFFHKTYPENITYSLKKAVLMGKNMDSYFPPNDFLIIGGYEVKDGVKKYYLL